MTADSTNWLGWQPTEWQRWIEDQLGVCKKVYSTDPDYMIAAYNRERGSARDYYGRELLELLQNADDAGAETTTPNQVLIDLADQTLCVANTGLPFSPAGVKSLMVSDNSPKLLSTTRFIGYKGLGFRSVLGWASQIVILSGNLAIGFDENSALQTARPLFRTSAAFEKRVEEAHARNGSYPVPILSFPYWLDPAGRWSALAERAMSLIKKGSDTVVAFELKSPATIEAVRSQLNSLGKELLIFSNCLERLEIESDLRNVVWNATRDQAQVVVQSPGEDIVLWEVFKDSGPVPQQYIGEGQRRDMQYEVKVAIPEKGGGQDRLFVYFPTLATFPFPVVAHATFELTGNRQHLIESPVNAFVGGRLAETMAQAAQASVTKENPWRALSLVSPRGALDPVLERLEFLARLKSACSDRRIAPVRGGVFAEPSKVLTLPGDFDSLLDGDDFSDVCLWTEDKDLKWQLSVLGAQPMTSADLVERIDRISPMLTVDERANLVAMLVENKLLSNEPPPRLLIDDKEELIPSEASVFLPPEGRTFQIPEWVPARLLSSSLTRQLQRRFKSPRVRDLSNSLNAFRVQEYNLSSIVLTIAAEANRRTTHDDPARELFHRQEMLRAIWSAYSAAEPDAMPDIAERASIAIPTRGGHFAPANTLYLGRDYPSGRLMEELLHAGFPDMLVAAPNELGIPTDPAALEAFLRWLGVATLPRESEALNPDQTFVDYVLASLDYPARFEELTYQNPNEIRADGPHMVHLTVFDHQEDILAHADHHAIIAWVAKDNRIEGMRTSQDTRAQLRVLPRYKQKTRVLADQSLPSYAVWLLENRSWLPIAGGKRPPTKCTTARGLPKEISTLIGVPEVRLDHELFKASATDRRAVDRALSTVGVVNDLRDLSWDTFYKVLMELPTLNPDGQLARSLYRALVASRDESSGPSYGLARDKFFSQGRMWGRAGAESGYYPVGELHYVDRLTLPDCVTSFFPLLELDKRRGAAKVQRLFNVAPLSSAEIEKSIAVTAYELHPCDGILRSQVECLKPYVYALRLEDDTDRSELAPLKGLDIRLCNSVEAEVHLENKTETVRLDRLNSIVHDSMTFLVAAEAAYESPPLENYLVADAVTEIVSAALGLEKNSEIALLATCPPALRLSLLNRIVGGSAAERLDQAKQLLGQLEDDGQEGVGESPTPHGELQPLVPLGAANRPSGGAPPSPQIPAADVVGPGAPSAVGPVSAKPLDVGPVVHRQGHRKLVVSSNAKPSTKRRLTNPDRAENLAMEFEKEQGRFTLKVSHLKGEKAFGCDLLSFSSEETKQSFEKGMDLRAVVRFIEVKGSSAVRGDITLRGNELKAAQDQANRYYLYRVYEDEDSQGTFELVELNDPLSCGSDALSLMYEVKPFQAPSRKLWSVKEIWTFEE